MKDFVEGPQKEYCPVLLGEGVIRYDTIIRWLKEHKPDIVIVREELDPSMRQKNWHICGGCGSGAEDAGIHL